MRGGWELNGVGAEYRLASWNRDETGSSAEPHQGTDVRRGGGLRKKNGDIIRKWLKGLVELILCFLVEDGGGGSRARVHLWEKTPASTLLDKCELLEVLEKKPSGFRSQ